MEVEGRVEKDSVEYLRRRERAERAAAKRALSNVARRIHQELAQKYAELLHVPRAPRQPQN